MSKIKYYSIIILFVIIFAIGMLLLTRQQNDYDLELWSYYSGGHNVAINEFNENSDYNIKFTGVAADNYTTKLDSVMGTEDMPDIIMLNSSDLGHYVYSDQFLDFDQIFKEDNAYTNFKLEASEAGLNLGNSDGQQKAIKFENSNSIFVYRSDLASECLGIQSPTEMNAATTEYTDYSDLYIQLQNSDNKMCNELSMFATSEYTNYLQNPNNIISKDYQVNTKVATWLEWIKSNIDTNLVYSRYGQYQDLIEDSNENKFFGDITTVNKLRSIYDFQQSGKWAVAQTPITYQGESSYFLISKDANLDAVVEFFDSTYFNKEWLASNINDIGIIENEQIMNDNNYSAIDLNSYFTNENLQQTLNEATDAKINNNNATTFDYGIRNAISGVMNDYIDGQIQKNQLVDKINEDIKIFYDNV